MLLFSGDFRLCNFTDIPCLAKNKRESYLKKYSLIVSSIHEGLDTYLAVPVSNDTTHTKVKKKKN